MEDQFLLNERTDQAVRRVFYIEDTTYGDDRKGFIVKYHGRLILPDSAEAYDRLAEAVKPLGLTPLFRYEDNRQTVILVTSRKTPGASNPRINLIFFILTLISVWFTGGMLSITELPPTLAETIAAIITQGWPFALSMLAILSAHEFGHYLAGRRHGAAVSLPYFLPLPFPISPFGTFGAFINMKELPKNRRVLMDIGIAGPLSGLVVAIPVLLIGLSLSPLITLPAAPAENGLGQAQLEGNSLLYLLLKFIVFGQMLPAPVDFGGLSPVLYWLRYIFTAQPLPYGGLDVSLHPVAWAGWGGLLITSLNLIPAGQLDGGHLLYVLFGRQRARQFFPLVLLALGLLGIFWSGWWLWAVLIFLFGRVYAEPLDQITGLDRKRKWLGVLTLIVFVLVFTPVPLTLVP
ncbi:MAG: site-2 protease family protein [Chloroflexota bacterium]|jgi:membrane-associated protease RseP (regulator of RpoE activity)